MEQSIRTRIIEFNGLAGCGKTTLARGLKDELVKHGYSVVVFDEACRIFKKHLARNIISCFSLSLFFQYIRLSLVIGRKKENTWRIYWESIFISTIYRWCLKSGEFAFILCDHGIIQNIISLLGFEELKGCKKVNECLASILASESQIYMVNCYVPIELSSKRIRIRKKITGRLDVISDEVRLKKLLQITELNFYTVRSMVKIIRKEWLFADLETDIPPELNVQKLLNLLTQGMINNEFQKNYK